MGTQVQILSLVRELARARRCVVDPAGVCPGRCRPTHAVRRVAQDQHVPCAEPRSQRVPNRRTSSIGRRNRVVTSRSSSGGRGSPGGRHAAGPHRLPGRSYSGSAIGWLRYRDSLVAGVAGADGVVVISDDTRRNVDQEALPVDRDRIFLVANGTDHLAGTESESIPAELCARGFFGGEFLLVMGRTTATRTTIWRSARGGCCGTRSHSCRSCSSAPTSPRARRVSARSRRCGGRRRGDVRRAGRDHTERNWLLRHASVVLYPTSAEGFGLVPFEAAQFGTPTAAVSFDPCVR